MNKKQLNKVKICSIVRTYLLLKNKCKINELYNFINFNGFNINQGITKNEIAKIIIEDKKKNGILKDVNITKDNNNNVYMIKR